MPWVTSRMAKSATPAVAKSRPIGVDGERGFVLVVVLWTVALLALFAATLTATTKVFLQTTRNGIEGHRLEFLADAGVRLALLDMMRNAARPDLARFVAGGPVVACRLPDGELLRISIEDDAGKIDLNSAGNDLLHALLQGVGLPEQQAANLLDAIGDWRDADNEKRPSGAELAEYIAAGKSPGPKNAPFESVFELGTVLGIDGAIFAKLRPHLTVHSGLAGIDPRHAAPDLLQLLAREGVPSFDTARSRDDAGRDIPQRFISPSPRQAFTIRSSVVGRNGDWLGLVVTAVAQERSAANRRAGSPPPLAENASRARPTNGSGGAQAASPRVPSFRTWQWERATAADERHLTGQSAPPATENC